MPAYWGPDTCGCVFEFTDPALGQVEANFANVTKACPAHAAAQGVDTFRYSRDENWRKNIALGLIEQFMGIDRTAPEFVDEISWYFDAGAGARRLHFARVGGFTQAQRNALNSSIELEFGINAVVLD